MCCIFCQKVKLMMAPENPNSICKPGTTFYCIFVICFWLPVIALFYFLTLGLGYGMTYGIYHHTHDMMTGKCLIAECEQTILWCSYDGGVGFYLGCVFVGFISEIVLAIGIIIIVFLSGVLISLISETKSAFKSAEHIANKNEPIQEPTDINIKLDD